MSAKEIDWLYDKVKSFHDSEDFKSVIPDLDSSNLIPKLREYQVDAVKWMMYKEYQLDSDNLPQEYNGMPIKYPRGGILADEMGLGKTVEMISLILNNPCNDPHCCTKTESDVFLDFEDSTDSSEIVGSTSGKKPQAVVTAVSVEPEKETPKESNADIITKNGKQLRKRQHINYAGLDNDFENEPIRKVRKKKNPTDEQPQEGPKSKKSETYQCLKKWYDQMLTSVNDTQRLHYESEGNENLKCACTGYYNLEEIRCLKCKSYQHKSCVGLDDYSVRHYYCPKCLVKMKPFKSRATFIVSPDSIVHQWMDEIKHHVKNDKLKVFYYTGVKGKRYIQPSELADNDIVITTYSALASDLNYCVEEPSRRLRYKKKFYTFPPPIKAIDWWRICLDEAQMVEGSNTKPGIMARGLMATYRWAVTGTPIQKSIHDLYGLMQFFMMEPFSELSVWNEVSKDAESIVNVLSHILWRSRKSHVYAMLGIPEQTVLNVNLTFSPVEGHFYEKTHAHCASQFQLRLNRCESLNVPLVSLDRAYVTKLMIPLLSLRQACTHPQAVRGKFLKYKKTMTMEELLSVMVSQAKLDIDSCVRTVVACNNGQAGLKVLLGELNEAVHLYRQVLQLPSQFSNNVIRIDKLQRLHTLHNLAEVISEFGVSEPTLHDDTLAQDAENLAREYIQTYERLINASFENALNQKQEVETLSTGRPLGFSEWWKEVIIECKDQRALVSKVRTNVLEQQTKFPIKCSYSNKIRNIDSLFKELALWLAETDDARIEVVKVLEKLRKSDPVSLSQQALCCHLRSAGDKSKRSLCQLCVFETSLLAYETRIFSITKEDQEGRKKNKLARSDDESDNEGESSEQTRKEIEELRGINIMKSKKEGNWKPGQMERIIQVILAFAKSQKFSQWVIQDGQKHLALLEAVRKEFLSLRTLWKHISDRVNAYDELNMAKMRYRLPLPEELKDMQKKKLNVTNIIKEHEICYQLERLSNERIVAERDLTKNIGIMMYLQNLQNNPNTERDPCPICQEPLSTKWSVLQCGHCFCFDCIPQMFANSHAMNVDCPVCRSKTHRSAIAYVDCRHKEYGDNDIPVRGSHSTKVEAVVAEALKINKNDSSAKILIFSNWDKVLDVVGEALEMNNITFRRLSNNKQRSKQSLADFKNSDVTGLLMPLRLGSKGLNLIEATHVFFVEPILNPADELQAVGRVHRIGQTKKTYVHRFVINNTIEDKMLTALSNNNLDEWSADKVTVQQLYSLFNRNDDNEQVSTSSSS